MHVLFCIAVRIIQCCSWSGNECTDDVRRQYFTALYMMLVMLVRKTRFQLIWWKSLDLRCTEMDILPIRTISEWNFDMFNGGELVSPSESNPQSNWGVYPLCCTGSESETQWRKPERNKYEMVRKINYWMERTTRRCGTGERTSRRRRLCARDRTEESMGRASPISSSQRVTQSLQRKLVSTCFSSWLDKASTSRTCCPVGTSRHPSLASPGIFISYTLAKTGIHTHSYSKTRGVVG